MIDREFRDQAAWALRRFIDCEIDNIDFENELPHKPLFGKKRVADPALRAIEDYVWHWYDDLSVHKLDGLHKLDDEERALGERCVLFLKSDIEYEWRNFRFVPGDLFSMELASQLPLDQQLAMNLNQPEGDVSVWPFFRRADYELARNAPAQHDLSVRP